VKRLLRSRKEERHGPKGKVAFHRGEERKNHLQIIFGGKEKGKTDIGMLFSWYGEKEKKERRKGSSL